MDVPEYAGALRRRWLWVLVPVLVTLGLAGWSVAASPPSHRSTAALYYVEPQQNLTPPVTRLNSYVLLATSEDLLDAVRADLGLDVSLPDLAGRVSARINPETSILFVTAVDDTPDGAQALAEAISRRLVAMSESLRDTAGDVPEGRLTISDPATPATEVTATGAGRTLALGALLGLLLGVVVALAREATDPRLTHPDQLRRMAPRWPVARLESGDEVLATPQASGRLRALRTAILEAPGRPRALVVTSCDDVDRVGGLADVIALSSARASVNVILMSALIHPGRTAVRAWALAEPGLSDVLLGRSQLGATVTVGPVGSLRVLSAGAPVASPEALLTSRAMIGVVRDLASRCESLVIDAPALLAPSSTGGDIAPAGRPGTAEPSPDTLGLVCQADAGVLLVVRERRTRRRALRAAVRLLVARDVTVLGVVFLSPSLRRAAHDRAGRTEPLSALTPARLADASTS